MNIVRPITDDGRVGYDEFGQLVLTRRDRTGEVSTFIVDVRRHTCAICARGWEATAVSMADQTRWHVLGEGLGSYVHESCLVRHKGLVERTAFLSALCAARIRFRGLVPIANEYFRAPDSWAAKPWYSAELVDHPVRIDLGWRKRVAEIRLVAEGGVPFSWWEAAEDAFAKDDVTKSFGSALVLLHAWGDDAVRDYLARLATVGGLAVAS
ncbi:hypothetical protein [Sandaracinus amylolyticus]|uniref:hypothetical protein n=1 Tax=Sandaracinus amylolyticus TaxID=927083 RepID=UPI001F3C8147|nr:hypothetical protein [Sandaracinus amylolyticus]UJR81447.1 Hypothetical protein I5071_35060 [Sandaracinus amylolyticus]